jgi:zinc protease
VREVVRVPDKSEASIVWGHGGQLKRSDPDFYAAQVMNLVLGGGGALNSRLGDVIRDEQGLAYDVYSFFDADLYPGPFQVGLGTNPANAEKEVRSLEAEIRRVREQGLTQREVDEAVAYLTGRFPQRLETNSGLAEVLWVAEFYNMGPDYIEKSTTGRHRRPGQRGRPQAPPPGPADGRAERRPCRVITRAVVHGPTGEGLVGNCAR